MGFSRHFQLFVVAALTFCCLVDCVLSEIIESISHRLLATPRRAPQGLHKEDEKILLSEIVVSPEMSFQLPS